MWKVGGKIVDGDVTHIVGIQLQVSLLRNSIYWWSRGFSKRDYFDHIQRRIQGKGPGGLGSPLFLDQTEVRRARKKPFLPRFYFRIWMTGSTPYLKVWIRQ